MSRVLLVLAALVILNVCVVESQFPPYYQDPKDKACEASGGHCHPRGDICRTFFENKIGYCCKNRPCCKCFQSNSCQAKKGHCHYRRPCSDFYESTIKACGCDFNGQHGVCCRCDNYRCGNMGGVCRRRCRYKEVVLTRSCGCYKGTKCCKRRPQYVEHYPYHYNRG